MYSCNCGSLEFVEERVISLAGAPSAWETSQSLPRTVRYRLVCVECRRIQSMQDREDYVERLAGSRLEEPRPKKTRRQRQRSPIIETTTVGKE